jgi:hypothetical protein
MEFGRLKLEQLKKAYRRAVAENEKIMFFDGHELVTGYAKYLIEYLEERLPR